MSEKQNKTPTEGEGLKIISVYDGATSQKLLLSMLFKK